MRLNSFFSLIALAAAGWMAAPVASAQTHSDPTGSTVYNPDANANGNIATYDLMELLSIFGQDVEVPHVVPASTVDELTDQVELLSQMVELQAQQLAMVASAVQYLQQVNHGTPFKWNAERSAWVCEEDVMIDAGLAAALISTSRITAGSGRFGGMGID